MQSTPIRMIVAQNVRRLRVKAGLAQEAFANRCGIHRTYLSDIERSQRNFSISTLDLLAAAAGVTVAELVTPHDAAGDPGV